MNIKVKWTEVQPYGPNDNRDEPQAEVLCSGYIQSYLVCPEQAASSGLHEYHVVAVVYDAHRKVLLHLDPSTFTVDYINNLTVADYEEVLADHKRLVRELDVAMHGEEGAAKQASLCDLIEPAKRLRLAAQKAK